MLALYFLLGSIVINLVGGLFIYVYTTSTTQAKLNRHYARLFPVPKHKPENDAV